MNVKQAQVEAGLESDSRGPMIQSSVWILKHVLFLETAWHKYQGVVSTDAIHRHVALPSTSLQVNPWAEENESTPSSRTLPLGHLPLPLALWPPSTLGPPFSSEELPRTVFAIFVALYCTMPRDYLGDIPLFGAMGFVVFQHDHLGAIPPPSELFSLGSIRSGRAIPPPHLTVSEWHLRDTRQNGCDSPSAILSRKGIARYGGGVLGTGPPSSRYFLEQYEKTPAICL